MTSNVRHQFALCPVPGRPNFPERAFSCGRESRRTSSPILPSRHDDEAFACDWFQVSRQRTAFHLEEIRKFRQRNRPPLREDRQDSELVRAQAERPKGVVIVSGDEPRCAPQLEIQTLS